MKKRIITAVVSLCCFIPVLIFAYTPALPITLALAAAVAVYEMLDCTGLKHSIAISIPFYLSALAFPFLLRYLPEYWEKIAVATLLLTVLYLFGVMIFTRGKYKISEIATAFLGITYSFVGLFSIQYLYDFVKDGYYVYWIIFIGAWTTDTFAYFCGRLFGKGGKHKLAPEISPKKTIEGSIGGIAFCTLAMVLYGFIICKVDVSLRSNYPVWILTGVAVSIVAQIGDLAFSAIKRHYGIKDFGVIFPGHGGILDRFDSVIAISVMLVVLTSFVDFFRVI